MEIEERIKVVEVVALGMDPPVFLKAGDVVELGIDGLGQQRHQVGHSLARLFPVERAKRLLGFRVNEARARPAGRRLGAGWL